MMVNLMVKAYFNSFLASADFCRQLKIFANSLHPADHDRHDAGPDLDPNRLTLW